VDMFVHLTSLVRASRSSRMSKNRRSHFISVSRRYPCTPAPAFRPLRRRHLCFEINSA